MTMSPKPNLRACGASEALVTALAAPSAAHAWGSGGVALGFAPFPSAYVPLPVYHGLPPVHCGPAAGQSAPAGQACYAGPSVGPLDNPASPGGARPCPTNSGAAGDMSADRVRL